MVRNPWREAFLSSNIKFILVAIVVLIDRASSGTAANSGRSTSCKREKLDVLTSSYIVGAALLIASPTLILFGWLSDIIGRKPGQFWGNVPGRRDVLPTLCVAWSGHQSGAITIRSPSSSSSSWFVCGHGVRPGRSLPGRVFPKPDPLHVCFRALPHRQWLGRGVGTFHHLRRIPVDQQRRLCLELRANGSLGFLGIPNTDVARFRITN